MKSSKAGGGPGGSGSTEDSEARKELFSTSSSSTSDGVRHRGREDHRAQDVTASFMELRSMLQDQVKSSEASVHNLVASSTKITSTKKEMQAVGATAKTSSALISKFERRELTDKVLIGACLFLYFGVVLYIIQKRLLWWLW